MKKFYNLWSSSNVVYDFQQRLAAKVQELHDNFMTEYIKGNKSIGVKRLFELPQDMYADSDIPGRLPKDLKFNP